MSKFLLHIFSFKIIHNPPKESLRVLSTAFVNLLSSFSVLIYVLLIFIVATYLLSCERDYPVFGICWVDQNTLIQLNYYSEQLIKYTIDYLARNCTSQVIDTGYYPFSASCSQNGQVVVTERPVGKDVLVLVRIYNVNTGYREVWNTNITSQSRRVHVSFNAEYIVISSDNVTYVYNKDRVLLYSVTHDHMSGGFWQTYITETGVFWGILRNVWKLLIMNLRNKDTKVSTEGIVMAYGVSGTSNGYVYVTNQKKSEVGVYLADGTFMHYLRIDPPETAGSLSFSAALRLNNTNDLIAFALVSHKRTSSRSYAVIYRAH